MSRHGPLISLAVASVASIGGTRVSTIAIPWLVLTTTGSPVLTGLVGFAEMLPYVLTKALGGPLIDLLGARRVAIWSDGLSTIAVMLVPLLFWLGLLSIWVLLPAVALIGVLRAPPTQQSTRWCRPLLRWEKYRWSASPASWAPAIAWPEPWAPPAPAH